jgi:hypothetical protein
LEITAQQYREGGKTEGEWAAHREEGRRGALGRRSTVVVGEGEQIAREGREPESRERVWPLAWARAGGLFLKRDMGASDSAQKKEFERAAAGAPDIAQCSVR